MHTFVGKKYHIYLDKKAIQELRVKEGPFFSGCQKGFLSKQTQDSDTVIHISCSPPAKSWCAVHDVAETHTVFKKSPLKMSVLVSFWNTQNSASIPDRSQSLSDTSDSQTDHIGTPKANTDAD
jgi:hypothetical protein